MCSLFVKGTRSMHNSIHSIQMCTYLFLFYDAKLQAVETPVAAKPSGILPNHTH